MQGRPIKLGKAEEGKPDSSLRQGKGRQRKAEGGKRQGRADENTGSSRRGKTYLHRQTASEKKNIRRHEG
jgi:hypothetical protein